MTINDRYTGLVWIRKRAGKEAEGLAEETIKAILPFKELINRITADDEKKFTTLSGLRMNWESLNSLPILTIHRKVGQMKIQMY